MLQTRHYSPVPPPPPLPIALLLLQFAGTLGPGLCNNLNLEIGIVDCNALSFEKFLHGTCNRGQFCELCFYFALPAGDQYEQEPKY